MRKRILFRSHLHESYYPALENLLFFNKSQKKVVSGIESSIKLYGVPKILNNNGIISIEIGNLTETQSIFAINPDNGDLAGLIVFYRFNIKDIVVLQISIAPDYTFEGKNNDFFILPDLFSELRKICKMLKGVENITIYYIKDKPKKIRV